MPKKKPKAIRKPKKHLWPAKPIAPEVLTTRSQYFKIGVLLDANTDGTFDVAVLRDVVGEPGTTRKLKRRGLVSEAEAKLVGLELAQIELKAAYEAEHLVSKPSITVKHDSRDQRWFVMEDKKP